MIGMLVIVLIVSCLELIRARSVHVSIATDWLSDPVAEIAEYLADQSNALFIDYIKQLCNSHSNIETTYAHALDIAQHLLPPNQMSLLRTAVGMGYYKPKIQFHHTISAHYNDPCNGSAFIVLPSRDALFCSIDEAIATISTSTSSASNEVSGVQESVLTVDDHILNDSSNTRDRAVIYGTYGTPSFCKLLEDVAKSTYTDIKYAIRFATHKPSVKLSNLHGYGVFLDIKNMEYKALDDRKSGDGDVSEIDDMDDDAKDTKLEEEVVSTDNSVQDDTGDHTMEVKKIKDLGLQMIAYVSKEDDKLAAIEEVLYNFPSKASSLSKRRVPRALRQQISSWYMKGMVNQLGHNCVFFNGLRIILDGASFNMFDIFDKLTSEMNHIRSLSLLPVGPAVKSKLVSLAMSINNPSSSKMPDIQRVDVSLGSKRIIVFMNNLEKDAMYKSWPQSVQQLTMPAWSLHSVAKNLYTVVTVLDPLSSEGIKLAVDAKNMWRQQFPVRFGFILHAGVLEKDNLHEVASMLETSPASRFQICTLYSFAKEYLGTSVALSFLMNLFEGVTERFDEKDVQVTITIGQLLVTFTKAVEKDKTISKTASKDLFWSILKDQVTENTVYTAKIAESDYRDYPMLTNAFIRARNLPVNSFSMNGIVVPRPTELYSELMQLIGREQYILGIAVREGTITDKTKSIFNAIFEPGKTFTRFHPMIFDNADFTYIDASRDVISSGLKGLPYLQKNGNSTLISSVVLLVAMDASGFSTLSAALEWFVRVQHSVRLSLQLHSDSDSPAVALLTKLLLDDLRTLTGDLIRDDGLSPDIYPHMRMFSLMGSPAGLACIADESCNVLALMDSDHSSHAVIAGFLGKWRDELQHCSSSGSGVPSLVEAGRALKHNIGVVGPTDVLLINGRMFPLQAPLMSEDFDMFFSVEYARIGTQLSDILLDDAKIDSSITRQSLSADEVVTVCGFIGRYASGSAGRTDVSGVLEKNGINVTDSQFIMHIAPTVKEEEAPSSIIQAWIDVTIYFVVDPLTLAGQRAVAVMKLVKEELELPFSVIFLPLAQYDKFPLQNFYRFVLSPSEESPTAAFDKLPRNHVLTVRPDVPESWNVQALIAKSDIDNLKCDGNSCGDSSSGRQSSLTSVVYSLKNLLVAGQCYEENNGARGSPPNGLQLLLSTNASSSEKGATLIQTDSLVMQNYGYFQFQANPGLWYLNLALGKASNLFSIVGNVGDIGKPIVVNSFVSSVQRVDVNKRTGMEGFTLQTVEDGEEIDEKSGVTSKMWSSLSSMWSVPTVTSQDETIHVFSLATGHMYERLLRIMMLSVTKRTSMPVKFWLFENYLSPTFKRSAAVMADEYKFDIGYVTFKWPEWLTQQTEKQRIIWGYKILFLDVLFPLDVKKIIYIDADQIMRADLKELWNIDLQGKPYAYTPFCASRNETLGFQFWRSGFWAQHLQGRPYHISALYVVDLELFRRNNVGDQLRSIYDGLARDPNSLANLDQDLPNYAQHAVPIHSLPQEWLWCESWCNEESKAAAKTIDLCNNPLYKEPKLDMARRIVSGRLFNESWIELDDEIHRLEIRRGLV